MSKNFMQSTSELCFADRDFLPSYCQAPVRRPSNRSNPDADEVQRFFGAEDDFGYLLSADSRQDIEDELDEDDDTIDDDTGLEELLVGAWAELDADEREEDRPLHPVRKVTLRKPRQPTREEIEFEMRWLRPRNVALLTMAEWDALEQRATELCKEHNRRYGYVETITKFVPDRPPLEPIDPEEAALRRASRREASEAISRSYGKDDRARGGNSKPRRIHDDRTTLRRG